MSESLRSSPVAIHWCVSYCLDHKQKLSVTALTGKGMPGGKGFLDIAMCKNELAAALVAWRRKLSHMPAETLSLKLANWQQDMVSFRLDMNESNVAWLGAMPPSDQTFVRIWEDWIAGAENDTVPGFPVSDRD